MASCARNWWSAVSHLVGFVMGVMNCAPKIELDQLER